MPDTLLDVILAPGSLRVVFQPILEHRSSGWHLHAFEGLVRGPKGTNLESADVLFAYSRRKGAERQVDRACLRQILREAGPLGANSRLTLNVHGVTLEQDPGFPAFLHELVEASPFAPQRITLEIVEHNPSWCGSGFVDALADLRERGFSIALDDVGLGHSNYRMILECRPDYFKIDRYLVSGSSHDFYRRAVLRSIGDLAGSFGAYAVAEGVDNVDDLATVLGEGLTTIQGFLLGRPVPATWLGSGELARHAARGMPEEADQPPWNTVDDWLTVASKRMTGGSGYDAPVAQAVSA